MISQKLDVLVGQAPKPAWFVAQIVLFLFALSEECLCPRGCLKEPKHIQFQSELFFFKKIREKRRRPPSWAALGGIASR